MNDNSLSIVIVGGGAHGMSTAYHLTQSYDIDVKLFEAGRAAGGSTGRSGAGISQLKSHELMIELMRESVKLFEEYSRKSNSFNFRQSGWVICKDSDEGMDEFEERIQLQRDLGVDVQRLNPEDIEEYIPFIRTDDLNDAMYCPSDGWTDPDSVTKWFRQMAAASGAEIHENTSVTDIRTHGNEVRGIETVEGEYPCDIVLNTAGAWSDSVAKMVGESLPVNQQRLELAITERVDFLSSSTPWFFDYDRGLTFRYAVGSSILGGRSSERAGQPADPDEYKKTRELEFGQEFVRKLKHRIPRLNDLSVVDGWAGLTTSTPDELPIVGPSKTVEGLYYSTGFNGGGFMLSPILGKSISKYMVEGTWPIVNLDPFSLDRFE